MKKNKNKNPVEEKDILHTVKLANLTLSSGQKERFIKQLEDILGYVSQIQSVRTDKIDMTAQVTGTTNVFRDDKITQGLSREEALSNAKKTYKGFIVVKNVFE